MEEKGKISQPINIDSLTTLDGDVKPPVDRSAFDHTDSRFALNKDGVHDFLHFFGGCNASVIIHGNVDESICLVIVLQLSRNQSAF